MTHSQLVIFSISLALLIFLAAFFSSAETGLMSINRYRLRHKARLKKRSAMLTLRLLQRPDRLLGVILMGSCFTNILASAVATLLAIHFWGEHGAILAAFLLTVVILIFAEVAPKTLAVLYPDRIAKWVSWPLFLLLKLLYPFVWLINFISNTLLRLFGVKVTLSSIEPLSLQELRSVVYETSGRLSHHYQNMLLSILDLNKITVNHVMVPQHEIVGIDFDQDWESILRLLTQSKYDWLPLYRGSINHILGVLHVRELMHLLLTARYTLNKEILLKVMQEPYFVPDSTPLNIQLLHFQQQRKRTALVVDEYGEIQGLLTLADILEEIVGKFTRDVTAATKIIQIQQDGSYLVDGAITLREFNRITQWKFRARGQRTLSGLIIEYLESIPRPGTCVRINDHPIEIVQVEDNRIKVARVFPRLKSD
ncbi:MAG: hypothetical protein ACD_60C00005G0013 [uncultured bacterium]|nr:MAG: hypothetical protein ACD_60C00005G0013 [uncultured bacterium]